MLNVQALTQTLSAMSLPQLQQYASLHKDDPYVVTMALSIANQKKQMQTAAQGQVGQEPMPKVVDQEIAQMAPRQAPMPETVGIGQLPAKNLQGMAAGGIVAFGDGGEVPRYQSQGLVQQPFYRQPVGGMQYGPQGYDFAASQALQANNPMNAPMQAISDAIASIWQDPRLSYNAKKKAEAELLSKKAGDAFDATTMATAGDGALPGAQPPGPTTPGAQPPVADAGANKTAYQMPQVKMPGFTPSAPVPVPTADELRTRHSTLMGSNPYYDPMEGQQKGINLRAEQEAKAGLAELQKDIEATGQYGKGREERIAQREGKLSKDAETNAGLAFLQAGLGIMSGTSPFAAVNIGQGAPKGIEAYIKGQEKIDAARERLDDARDRLEDIRRNEDTMNRRELRAAKAEVGKTVLQGERDLLAGARMAYGENSKLANTLLGIQANAEDTSRRIASSERLGILDAQTRVAVANRPPEAVQTALILGKGDVEKGMTRMAEIQAGKWDPRNAYTQYMLGWNKNAQANPLYADQNPMLNFSQFIGQFTIPTGGGDSSMAGKDRARPGM